MAAEANVDGEEGGCDDNSQSSENTHDGVDDDVDGKQLLNSTVSRWSDTCADTLSRNSGTN